MRRFARHLYPACSLAITLFAGSTFGAPPEVRTESGELRGSEIGDILAFRGIPYAAPPIGPLRWQPPRTPQPWRTPRDASHYSERCPQTDELGLFSSAGGSEDCLYLNVFVKRTAVLEKQKLPVLVWIHGGALAVGAASDYDPGKLVAIGNVVVVSINYRLGIFGFFAHPELDQEGHKLANYGLMDQLFALHWIHKNISAFGGDPANVTIFGESSGGNSVFSQVISPDAAGLFQQAIAMSGAALVLRYPAFGAPRPLAVAEKMGSDFSAAVGCGNRGANCLRSLTVQTILAHQSTYRVNQPIIDGTVLPMHPADALKSGTFNKVRVINGTTLDEATFFAALPELATGVAMDEARYAAAMTDYYGASLAPAVLKEYPTSAYTTPSEAYAAAVTSSLFSCPAHAINRWIADKVQLYVYEFSDRTAASYLGPTTFALGAAHTFELPYIFAGFHGGSKIAVQLNPLQQALSDRMIGFWSQVGRAGALEPHWQRYDAAGDNVLALLLPEPVVIQGQFAAQHHCGFWDKSGLY